MAEGQEKRPLLSAMFAVQSLVMRTYLPTFMYLYLYVPTCRAGQAGTAWTKVRIEARARVLASRRLCCTLQVAGCRAHKFPGTGHCGARAGGGHRSPEPCLEVPYRSQHCWQCSASAHSATRYAAAASSPRQREGGGQATAIGIELPMPTSSLAECTVGFNKSGTTIRVPAKLYYAFNSSPFLFPSG